MPDKWACGSVFNIREKLNIPEAEIEKFLELPTLFSSKFGK